MTTEFIFEGKVHDRKCTRNAVSGVPVTEPIFSGMADTMSSDCTFSRMMATIFCWLFLLYARLSFFPCFKRIYMPELFSLTNLWSSLITRLVRFAQSSIVIRVAIIRQDLQSYVVTPETGVITCSRQLCSRSSATIYDITEWQSSLSSMRIFFADSHPSRKIV